MRRIVESLLLWLALLLVLPGAATAAISVVAVPAGPGFQIFADGDGTNDVLEVTNTSTTTTFSVPAGVITSGGGICSPSAATVVCNSQNLSTRVGLGAGDDQLRLPNPVVSQNFGPPLFDGQGDNDTISYAGRTTGVTQGLTSVDSVSTASSFENLVGSDSGDTLTGDGNPNVLEGGGGTDTLNGGGGTDLASYASRTTPVTDSVAGPHADGDTWNLIEGVRGGAGDDNLTGTDGGNDPLQGGPGRDAIDGLGGADTQLLGGTGNDTIRGGAGPDSLTGEGDDDVLIGGADSDVFSGGPGTDLASYEDRTTGIVATFDGQANDGEGSEGENLGGDIEGVRGGSAADRLTGGAGNNRLEGVDGDDLLVGGGGADALVGGPGIDTASYEDKTVAITATLNGAPADDGQAGENDGLLEVENVRGGSSNDTLIGDAGANTLEGGAGDDVIDAGGGPDALVGGDGADRMVGSAGTDTFSAGAGDDTLRTLDGVAEDVDCGEGVDVNEAADILDRTVSCELVNRPAPGGGSVPPPNGGNAAFPAAKARLPRLVTTTLRPDRRRRGSVTLQCPASAPVACAGTITIAFRAKERVRRGKAKKRVRLLRKRFTTAKGKRTRITFTVPKDARSALALKRSIGLTVTLAAPATARSSANTTTVKLTLKRR